MSLRELNILLDDQMQWVRHTGDPDQYSPFIYEERLRSERNQNTELRARRQNSEHIIRRRRSTPHMAMNGRHWSQSPQRLARQRSRIMRTQPTLRPEQYERMMAVIRGRNPIVGPRQFLPNPRPRPSQPIPNPRQNLLAVHRAQQFSRLPSRYIIVGERKESCPICLLDYENGERVTLLPCRHVFHPHCIFQWIQINPICPLCRRPCFQQRTWINMCLIL